MSDSAPDITESMLSMTVYRDGIAGLDVKPLIIIEVVEDGTIVSYAAKPIDPLGAGFYDGRLEIIAPIVGTILVGTVLPGQESP